VGRPWLPATVGLLLTAGICFEFLPAPFPLSPPDTPGFYYALARDGADYAVLNLPMDWDRPSYLLHQTVHGKRLTSAYTSRDNPLSLVDGTPVLQDFRRPALAHVVEGDPADVGLSVFDAFGIRYVVIDRFQMPEEAQRRQTLALVRQVFGEQWPVYQDERLVVYEVAAGVGRAPFVGLGRGWSSEEVTDAGPRRIVERDAEIVVHSPSEQSVALEVTLFSATGGQVVLTRAGSPSGRYALEAGVPATLEIAFAAAPGDNVVSLRFEGGVAPELRRVRLVR